MLLYLALSNTEVISKANSRMGTVLAAVCRERPVNIAALTGEASVQLWACLQFQGTHHGGKQTGLSLKQQLRIFHPDLQATDTEEDIVCPGILKAQNSAPATHLLHSHGHTYSNKATSPNPSQLLAVALYDYRWMYQRWGLQISFGSTLSFRASVLLRPLGGDIQLWKCQLPVKKLLILHEEVGQSIYYMHWLVWSRLCAKLSPTAQKKLL